MENNKDLVIACIETMQIWGFISEGDDPQIELNIAKEYKSNSIKTWLSHAENYPSNSETFLNYAEKDKRVNYKIMTYCEFEKKQSEYFLNLPLTEVTEEIFNEMLSVLPPKNWVTIDGCNEFCMSEFLTACYTSQYARKNGKFYHKTVDYFNADTWIHNFLK